MSSQTAGGSADSHVVDYRPDVDGLRAVAVLAVIAFHLREEWLPGGYLGVDVFFVISGYLITLVIWREMQIGEFTIIRFYNRRIRRILPALLVVLSASAAVGLFLLLPGDLVKFSWSLTATLFFLANMYFLRGAQDYFAPAAEVKPLLHMWSLGVEEQFYIFFPLILILVARYWGDRALIVVALLAIGSLITDVLARALGFGDLAFYLLPTRAWELGIGALAALAPKQNEGPTIRWALLGTVGAVLVAWAFLHPFASKSWLPPPALPAVLGTVLLIQAGQHRAPGVTRLLQWRPVVFVGLISYSLYLWHWPIIVLTEYYLVRDLLAHEIVVAVTLMFACAVLSWHYVERPFRGRSLPIRSVYVWNAFGVTTLLIVSAGLVFSDGLPNRLPAESRIIAESVDSNYRCSLAQYVRVGDTSGCLLNLPSRDPVEADLVLLGNSHVKMYAPAWKEILEARGERALIVWAGSCLPTLQANISLACIKTAQRNLRAVLSLPAVHTVVIGLTWWHGEDALVEPSGRVLDNRENRALVAALDDLIARLSGAGKMVVLIGPIAEPGYDVASVVSRQLAFGHPLDRPLSLPAADFTQRFDRAIKQFSGRADVAFARPDLIQCPADTCEFFLSGRALFADRYHIAAAETLRFRGLFDDALRLRP